MPAVVRRESSHTVPCYASVWFRLTPVNRSLPLSGPSSLSPGSPEGTHGRVLGLEYFVWNKWSSETSWTGRKAMGFRDINVWHAPDRKKVSCWSLAGCCWGWNRESKFQKELSMKLLVGISVKLQKAESLFYVLFMHVFVRWLISLWCLQTLTPSPGRSAWTVCAPSSAGAGGHSQGPRPGPQSCRA